MPMSQENTGTSVSFGEAAGRKQADASLADFVGKTISIKSFEQESRTIQDKPGTISYITLEDGKVLYTWSGVVSQQLTQIKESLESGKTVTAKVVQKKTAQGRYVSLE